MWIIVIHSFWGCVCGKIYPVPTSPVSIVGPADVPNCTTPSPFLSFVVIFFLSSFLPFFLIHIFAGPRFHDSPPDGFPRCTPDHNRVRSVRPPRRIYCGRHSERSMTCFILFYYSLFFLSFYVTFEKKRKEKALSLPLSSVADASHQYQQPGHLFVVRIIVSNRLSLPRHSQHITQRNNGRKFCAGISGGKNNLSWNWAV